MDEAMVASLRDSEHSTLSQRHKLAMRLVDAFILGFGKVSPDVANEAQAVFSDAELFEIGLTVFTCSTNKILVSLGVDDPENVEEVMGIRIHEDFYPPWP
jgi:hypothetical protein